MKVIDISWPISEKMTEYKDGKTVKLTPVKSMENNGAREYNLSMSNHTGTHVDAAAHFLATGQTIDRIELSLLVGPCRVLDLTSVVDKITPQDLEGFNISQHEIILLKTTNSFREATDRFTYSFVYIDKEAAEYLVAQNIKAIGFDYLGIERNQPEHETHKAFMQFNIPIVEGLRLGAVSSGNYFFCCLPLNCTGIDSAPARAILIEDL
ncbi:MAG: cyclase family protein [Candidatus Babeliales bacterium]